MRAVVLDAAGQPRARRRRRSPAGPATSCACSPAGSAGRTSRSSARAARGHGARARGRRARSGRPRVALLHHRAAAASARAASPGTSRPASEFPAPTIRPGGFAERVRRDGWVDAARTLGRRARRPTSSRSPACSAGRSGCRAGACSSSATASSAGSSAPCSSGAATRSFAVDRGSPPRPGRAPDGPVDAAVLCAPGGADDGARRGRARAARCSSSPTPATLPARPGLPAGADRRRARARRRRRTWTRRVALLPELELPEPTVLPLERFAEGLELYRSRDGAEGRLHPVRALRFHGPGDLRLEDVPRPEPGPGDVLVQVEVALTDGTDLKAFRRGHPVLLGAAAEPVRPRVLRVDVATGRRVVAANSAPCGACAACRAGQETLCENLFPLLNGAYAEFLLVPGADRARRTSSPSRPGSRPRSRRWSSRSRAACTASTRAESQRGRHASRSLGLGPIGLMLCACVADAGGAAGRRRLARGAARARAVVRRRARHRRGADVVIEAAGTTEAWERRARARPPGRHRARLRRAAARGSRAASTRTGSTTRR